MKTNSLFYYSILILLFFTITSCNNDDGIEINNPELSIALVDNITFTTAEIESEIILNNTQIVSKGICWSTSPNATINDNKTNESNLVFTSLIANLTANTTYYYKIYASSENETYYSEEASFNTLNIESTDWDLTTVYSPNDYKIYSRINLYEDGTTKFDELDLPGQGPGLFITYGTWTLDGNNFTYNFDSSNPSNPVYIYTGVLTGLEMSGTYSHVSAPNGTWSAIIQ